MMLDARNRRILRACIEGATVIEIATREGVGRSAIKKQLDLINQSLPSTYRNRSKRILYPVLLLKVKAISVEELVGLI